MITHTVLFRLNRPVDDAARDRFVAALRAFALDPPFATGAGRVHASLGLREGPRAADALVQIEFEDAERFAQYIADPRHVGLISDVLEPS